MDIKDIKVLLLVSEYLGPNLKHIEEIEEELEQYRKFLIQYEAKIMQVSYQFHENDKERIYEYIKYLIFRLHNCEMLIITKNWYDDFIVGTIVNAALALSIPVKLLEKPKESDKE